MVSIEDYRKINDFLLQNKIDPILYGSLGVSIYLGKFKEFNDIDILIEDIYISGKWQDLIKIMNDNGFELIDVKEHEFKNKQNIIVAFAGKNILVKDNICDLKKDIQIHNVNGMLIKTLAKKAFIKAYLYSSNDGYRKEKRGKNDLEIVRMLNDFS